MSTATFYATQDLTYREFWDAATTQLELDGFKARLMRAARLRGDHVHGLPPGTPIPVFRVDEFPGCPDHWVRARGSYFCPVEEGWGLWYDWTHCPRYTAIVPSTQGVNPVTGQKSDEIRLEKYVEKCPIHDVEFVGDRLCEKCGYTWPCQNYIAPPNILWWDGWRQQGKVRQFCFTAEEERIVADKLIGKENTVPAFGFAMFSPVNPPEEPEHLTRGITPWTTHLYLDDNPLIGSASPDWYSDGGTSKGMCSGEMSASPAGGGGMYTTNYVSTSGLSSGGILRSAKFNRNSRRRRRMGAGGQSCGASEPLDVPEETAVRSLGVGAGAQIDQDLVPDPHDLDWWRQEPSALFRLYFCFEEEFAKIVAKGRKDLSGEAEGFLKDIPVG